MKLAPYRAVNGIQLNCPDTVFAAFMGGAGRERNYKIKQKFKQICRLSWNVAGSVLGKYYYKIHFLINKN